MVSERHIASGIEAVIDNAHVSQAGDSFDVWVPESEVADAIRQARKLGGGTYKPSVWPSGCRDDMAIRV